jgi:NAD(P)-dependent dehydrogenase (short-subunit alcohol dehydrogenase family)
MIGMVESPLIVARQGAEVLEKRRRAIPLQTAGTGWDVGWAAVYLASDESRWVTGIELPIDGGQLRILEGPR